MADKEANILDPDSIEKFNLVIDILNSMPLADLQNTDLSALANRDNINPEKSEALYKREYEMKREKEILSQFKIYQFKSGKYKGQYFAKKGKKKVHQAATREALEKKLIDLYSDIVPPSETSFKAMFLASQEDYLKRVKDKGVLESKKGTVNAHKKSYNRFIAGTSFENKPIQLITKNDITNLCDDIVVNNDIKEQAFKNLKTVLNQTFNYAIKVDVIRRRDNPMDDVYWADYKDSFVESAPIDKRAFTVDELSKIYTMTRALQEEEPKEIKYWSYEFMILTGTRRAEVPPLKWSDVHLDEGYIDIHQELIGSSPFVIKQSTKTGVDRYFPITESLADFLARLKENNDKYHPNSEFLFPDKDQTLGCITPYISYRAHRKVCEALGIEVKKDLPKGTHAFRRTHMTSFIENGGSKDLSSKVYGNSPKVADQFYILTTNSNASAPIIEQTQQLLSCGMKR